MWAYRIMGAIVFALSLITVAGVFYFTDPDRVIRNEAAIPQETNADGPDDPGNISTYAPEITRRKIELAVGESTRFNELSIREDEASSKTRITVFNEEIISVDPDGNVTAVSPGIARIRVTGPEFRIYYSIKVTIPLREISFEEDEIVLEKRADLFLTLRYDPENTTDHKEAFFSSSDETVVTVDEVGHVRAIEVGEAEITARIGDHEAVCHIKVESKLTGIHFSFSNLTVRVGDTVELPLFYDPADTTDQKETVWKSSNPAAVTVDQEGRIRATGAGKSTIRATCNEFTAEAVIEVVVPMTGIAIDRSSITLNKGQQTVLSASPVPANTTEDRYITFSSDNTSVARVDSNGVITAVAPGTAHITANHDLLGAVSTVTVLSPLRSISISQERLSLIEGFSATLSVFYDPVDTTDPKAVIWSSENPSVATVDGNGTVQAVSVGQTRIVADVNGIRSYSEMTVLPFIEVERVELSETAKTFTSYGETASLHATVYPFEATNGTVSYESSDTAVATVDGTGTVRAVGRGTAVITASAGSKSATCNVTVSVAEVDRIVVLDPGHGGKFAGASYYGRREEILTLIAAKACKSYLETHYFGVKVYLTRTENVELRPTLAADLEARAQFAQDKNADILVSLHFNASNTHKASGALCFISNQPAVTDRCRRLANAILAKLQTTGLKNLGAVTTNSDQYFDEFGNPKDYYAINRHSANRGIPGIIVEHCFMDVDTEYIDTTEKIELLGQLDAIGIANYLGLAAK